MEHQGLDYIASQQAIAQYFDPKNYEAEDKQNSSTASQVQSKSRELIGGGDAYPYQFSRQLQHSARSMYDTKQRVPATPSHVAQSTRHRRQDYSHMTAMQQRQEYVQRMTQHQQMINQREYIIPDQAAMKEAAMKEAAKRMTAETTHQIRSLPSYDHAVKQGPRQSAFCYTSSHHQPVSKLESPMDSVLGGGFMQHHPASSHPISNHPAMRRSLDARPSYHPREHYTMNTRTSNHPNEMVANKIPDVLRDWEAHTNQMHSRDSKPLSHPKIPAPINRLQDHMPSDQFEAKLEHLKGVVRQMEMIREQRDKYKSSAFQYLEKLGGQITVNQRESPTQSNLSPPGLAKRAYSSSCYQTMHNIPKFIEQINPQKSPVIPPNKCIDPTKVSDLQKQLALYQNFHAEQQRLYPNSQSHHVQSHSMQKKEANPIQFLSQKGLPKIVDVRSLADRQNTIDSAISRHKRRSSEPLIGDGRSIKMRMSSSPDGYRYEIADTRADSCDSGVESLASPESHVNSHVYNRNVMPHVQQQQLEAVKAQHAASFDAMKRQQLHQQQKQQASKQFQRINSNVQFERTGMSNVQLERAGSPRKLSELIGKEESCPSLIKGIDSLTCSCPDCKLHQEKTEIEIRDLYREKKIKRYSGSTPVSSSVPKPMYYEAQNPAHQKEIVIIDESSKPTGKQNGPSLKDHSIIPSSVTAPESERMKISIADEVLDLSKKPSQPKLDPATKQTLLEVGSNVNMEKDQTTQLPRGFTATRVSSSSMREQSEGKTQIQKTDVRCLGDIITVCLDHDQSLDMNDKTKMTYEELNKAKDNTKIESDNDAAVGQIEMLNTSRNDGGDVKEMNALKEQPGNKILQDLKSHKDVTEMEQSSKSEVDKICESPVVLKVMVQKLNLNSDMYFPGKDAMDENHLSLPRASSFSCFNIVTSDEVEPQRPQSVGFTNTLLPSTSPSASLPSLVKDKLQGCEVKADRPFSAPPNAVTLNSKESKQIDKETAIRGHELASLYQSMDQDALHFPKNLKDCWSRDLVTKSKNINKFQSVTKYVTPQSLKDCWIDSTSGDNKKSKELIGNPKMQWKAQWAKEKCSLKKSSELVLCEICGASNSVINQDGDNNCKHELQQAVIPTSAVSVCQQPKTSSQKGTVPTKHETTSPYTDTIQAQQTTSSHRNDFNFESLFQPKQFQPLFIESTKFKVDRESSSIIGVTTTPDVTPTKSSSLAVINGKQHGKATIFHQPKIIEQNIDQNNPPNSQSIPRDYKMKLPDLDKNDGKHFPKLLPSPTAAFDNSSFCMQEQDSGRISQTVAIPQTSFHIKNVLRVTPNVVQLPSASHTQQISMENDSESMESSKEPQNLEIVDSHSSTDRQNSSDNQGTQTLSSQFTIPSTEVKMVQSCDNLSKTHCMQATQMANNLQFVQSKDKMSTADTKSSVQMDIAKNNDKSGHSVIPTSVVSPMMKSVTTTSIAQTMSTESKSELSKTTSPSSQSLVQGYTSTLQPLTRQADEVSKRTDTVEPIQESPLVTSCMQIGKGDVELEMDQQEPFTSYGGADCDQGNQVTVGSVSAVSASPGQCAGVQFANETASEPLCLVSKTVKVSTKPLCGAKNNQPLPKLLVSIDPKVPNRVNSWIGPPPLLILTQSQTYSLSSQVSSQSEQPVTHLPSACVDTTLTSTMQVQSSSSAQSWTNKAMPTLISETFGKIDSPSNVADKDQKYVLQSPLENINQTLKSTTPHTHVPKTNGFIRYQKDSQSMREIYRVEVHDELQQENLKLAPRKKPLMNASNVEYLQTKFPCVIRSDVPFVPPQMIHEAFFSTVDYGEFNFALQKCGILHRYMTVHEQGAMSRACASRTWNRSCKLIPLDEFDAKYEQMTKLLQCATEKQKIL